MHALRSRGNQATYETGGARRERPTPTPLSAFRRASCRSSRLDFIARDNPPVSLPSPLIVVGVGADPDPVDPTLNLCPESTVTIADADRPELPELLEVKRRMTGVGFQKSKVLVRQLSRLGRQ